MPFENSTSFFPVGSLNPQSSLYSHGIAGQFTLHPIVITISTRGIFVVLFLFQQNSFKIHLKKGVLTMLPQFDYDTYYVHR